MKQRSSLPTETLYVEVDGSMVPLRSDDGTVQRLSLGNGIGEAHGMSAAHQGAALGWPWRSCLRPVAIRSATVFKTPDCHQTAPIISGNRVDKMRYADFRSKGYFIGSGNGESANKYLVQQGLNRPA
jgi:hypothetical protein